MVRRLSNARWFLSVTAIWMCSFAMLATVTTGQNVREKQEPNIAELIRQLGAPAYASREKAQAALERLGLEAFDALNDAQNDDDIEIALRARYLVRSMQVNWSRDDDSPVVKQLLRGYGNKPDSERRSLMEQLALLGQDGLAPLCRLVRYEASQELSKRAALLVIRAKTPESANKRREVAETIVTAMGTSKRTASQWLRNHAESLEDARVNLVAWKALTDEELDRLNRFPQQTSREIVRDLLRWYADMLVQSDQESEATGVMRQTLGLLEGKREQVLDTVDWLRERERWSLIPEAQDRFPDTFKSSPLLLYRLADAWARLDRPSDAERAANQALQAVTPEARDHLVMGVNLQHDGLFDCADKEFRHVIGAADEDPSVAVSASFFLSEMLHETGKHQAGATVLQELLDSMHGNEEIRKVTEIDYGRPQSGIQSRMYFFLSRHHAKLKEFDKERELLEQGFAVDEKDADVLIAMYRLPNVDQQYKDVVRKRITTAVSAFRKQIKELDERLPILKTSDRVAVEADLATANNQLAWLVSNTEGDFDEAIRCSLRSLDLRADAAGYYDTLGRCYFAKGDFVNAVQNQAKAAEMEPHSPQIVRQLELFQKALHETASQ
jgi:tetratricopeptide (TPR) repeat protein